MPSACTVYLVQAEAARDAVIKAVYTKLFDWIVAKVNTFISGGDAAAALPYVGLLDIFGFENFTHNSFEQVPIHRLSTNIQRLSNNQALFECRPVPMHRLAPPDRSSASISPTRSCSSSSSLASLRRRRRCTLRRAFLGKISNSKTMPAASRCSRSLPVRCA